MMAAPRTVAEVRKNARGRPSLAMTPKRAAVYFELSKCVSKGGRMTLAELARRCRLHDYRDARRTVNDLKKMGVVR